MFRSDLLFLSNNLNIFLMNSISFMRIQVRVQKICFFEFKFEFGKMIEFFRVQVRVRSPGLCRICMWILGPFEALLRIS